MKKRITAFIILMLFIFSLSSSAFADALRFGYDDQNTRRVQDSYTETALPFQKFAEPINLGGKVFSQPIIIGNNIYTVAGKNMLKLAIDQKAKTIQTVKSYPISDYITPAGSSPTYHNGNIYIATRDHRLWKFDTDLNPAWNFPDGSHYYVLSAKDKPDEKYRVTAAPLLYERNNKTFIAIGTARGDGEGSLFADNGFLILEDHGSYCKYRYRSIAAGEVTGSPIIHGDMIIGTQNTSMSQSNILRYLIYENRMATKKVQTDRGIPGSPAAEGNAVYVVDQTSAIYKFYNNSEENFYKAWQSPKAGDSDFGRLSSSYNLHSPAIGEKYVIAAVQHYKSKSSAGPGGLVAVDKNTGATKWVWSMNSSGDLKLRSPIKSNISYWRPNPAKDGMIFVLEAGNTSTGAKSRLWCINETTGKPIAWFKDSTKPELQYYTELNPIGQGESAPEPVIGNSMLVMVDGKGVLHSYKGMRPINFRAASKLSVAPFQEKYKDGDTVNVSFAVENTSEKDYTGIPVVLRNANNKTMAETKVDLLAGEKKTVSFSNVVLKPREDKTLQGIINPTGHPEEKKDEAADLRGDNPTEKFRIGQDEYDLLVYSMSAPGRVSVSTNYSVKTDIKNNSADKAENVLVRWTSQGKTIKEERITLDPGGHKLFNFSVKAPSDPSNVTITCTVDPTNEFVDTNRKNNYQSVKTEVYKAGTASCGNQKPNGSWDVWYDLITGYDKDGDPIWSSRKVNYTESLAATVDINTKQHIPTDPNNPNSASYRESRGSWEIIPWAKKNGLNAKEVTRAGYGFEVTVTTNYTNNWESKVPKGYEGTARPYGGTYPGPAKVTAAFYDTSGKLINTINLERVSGTSGKGSATWKLPEQTYRFSDGATVKERKHYTSPDIKDGDYTVVVTMGYAGRTNLLVCQTKKVRIFGSMYDDIYIAPSSSN